jgi:ADP-heptose:LPS heptosyltransferase
MRFSDFYPARWFYFIKLPFKYWAYELIDQLILHFVPAGKRKAVLIFRLDLIGDYLMCRPFFQVLSSDPAFSDLPMSFAGNQVLKSLAEELDAVVFSDFTWIDRPRFINSLGYRFRILADIRRKGYSMVIYPSHTRQFWLESLVRVSGAEKKITASAVGRYMSDMETKLSAGWYSSVIDTGSLPMFEFYRNRLFFSSLSPSAAGVDSMECSVLSRTPKQKLLLFAPGASTEERKWPSVSFSQLIMRLQEILPGFSFGIIGSRAEREECNRIAEESGVMVYNYAGECSLPESLRLIAGAILLVSNESSPVHMAATTGTACVVISNGNHFSRWNPYPESLAPRILTCYPSRFGNVQNNREELTRQYHHHSSLSASEVPIDSVLKACLRLLNGYFSVSE